MRPRPKNEPYRLSDSRHGTPPHKPSHIESSLGERPGGPPGARVAKNTLEDNRGHQQSPRVAPARTGAAVAIDTGVG